MTGLKYLILMALLAAALCAAYRGHLVVPVRVPAVQSERW